MLVSYWFPDIDIYIYIQKLTINCWSRIIFIPHLIISYHIISYHIISYHIISYPHRAWFKYMFSLSSYMKYYFVTPKFNQSYPTISPLFLELKTPPFPHKKNHRSSSGDRMLPTTVRSWTLPGHRLRSPRASHRLAA